MTLATLTRIERMIDRAAPAFLLVLGLSVAAATVLVGV